MRLEKHMMRLAAQCKSDLVVLRICASSRRVRTAIVLTVIKGMVSELHCEVSMAQAPPDANGERRLTGGTSLTVVVHIGDVTVSLPRAFSIFM